MQKNAAMTGVPLLNTQDPDPVRKMLPPGCASPFALIGDHTGSAIPAALGDLGLSAADRARHIAIDIGVEALGRALAPMLDAPFISQAYSRLVVDCNRDPAAPTWIAAESDGSAVPGNIGLSPEHRAARHDEIFEPYHRAIADLLDARADEPGDTILVSLHSFTPQMNGERRPWEVGVLHAGHCDAFALAVLAELRDEPGLVAGDNQPYRMDTNDYTVPRHAWPRRLDYVEIEVRQDLLADAAGVARIAALLARVLPAARTALTGR